MPNKGKLPREHTNVDTANHSSLLCNSGVCRYALSIQSQHYDVYAHDDVGHNVGLGDCAYAGDGLVPYRQPIQAQITLVLQQRLEVIFSYLIIVYPCNDLPLQLFLLVLVRLYLD